MSHFNFENCLNELTRMDAPIQQGPLMRWQRKAQESGIRHLSVGDGGRSSSISPRKPKSASGTKTPNKSATPLSSRLTPNKTPSGNRKSSKTPNKKTPNTPHGQDRFIPNRGTTNTELGHFLLTNNENEGEVSPTKAEYQRKLSGNINQGQTLDDKILSFKQKAPKAAEGYYNNLKVLYTSGKCSAPKATSSRQIPQQPERILDAPELIDDYYLNLLDWSSLNFLSVALGDSVFLWNAGNGTITELMQCQHQDEHVSSVEWINEGNILAVGISLGTVQLWDVSQQKLIRTMGGHASRVGSLSWNSYILSSGSRSGTVHHHDVRVANHHVCTLSAHSQEVCGLAWSPDGRYLASGGNDNLLNIWDNTLGSEVMPLHTFTHHQAAVKALSWCPWQPTLLASGGGTADRHIRFWNINTGAVVQSVDTNSQVCAILWSKEHKELISGHGYSQNQLSIWKYPNMNKVTDLTGHTSRVLSLKMSPDGSTVASAAADETIRLWKCFATDKSKKAQVAKAKDSSSLSMLHRGGIR